MFFSFTSILREPFNEEPFFVYREIFLVHPNVIFYKILEVYMVLFQVYTSHFHEIMNNKMCPVDPPLRLYNIYDLILLSYIIFLKDQVK